MSETSELWKARAAAFSRLVQRGNERQRQLERIYEDIQNMTAVTQITDTERRNVR